MSNPVEVFAFDSHAVRCVQRDGEPWFVAADVCRALEIRNPTQATERLDDDERDTCPMKNIDQSRDMLIVSESGLYTLILRSHGATNPGTVAHRFRKWVTAEVLPSIRRTGRYQTPAAGQRPHNLNHRADNLTSADRVFRAALRSGRAAGLQGAVCIRVARDVALRHTGVDLFDELGPDAAKGTAPPAYDPDQPCPAAAAAQFWAEWRNGELPLPVQLVHVDQLYQAYLFWCHQRRVKYPLRQRVFAGRIGTVLDGTVERLKRLEMGRVMQRRFVVLPEAQRHPPAGQSQKDWLAALGATWDAAMRRWNEETQ